MSYLQISSLSKAFGGNQVIRDFSLEIGLGERHAIIGPNGAGKTTLFNMITGWLRPDAGTVLLGGLDISHATPRARTRLGLARSFQRNTLFGGLTVRENLRLAIQAMSPSRWNPWVDRSDVGEIAAEVGKVADAMRIREILERRASEISYGDKRKLEVALALCSRPKVLLLDEPAAGASPEERSMLTELLLELPADITLVLVEHDMDVVFDVCSRITVLTYGRVIASGSPDDVRANAEVRDAYLGHGSA